MVHPSTPSHSITLANGRRIAYSEFGDDSGIPLIYCHGLPSSRIEACLADRDAKRLGLRVIAADRPGYGESDYHPERKMTDFADDMEELADRLELERFAVLGVSCGGPYALSLAARIPQRISAVSVCCGLGPVYRADARNAMSRPARLAFNAALSVPWLLWLVYGPLARLIYYRTQIVLGLVLPSCQQADRAALSDPDRSAAMLAWTKEGLRQGARGALRDYHVYVHDWGFRLDEIAIPVVLWHGESDSAVPIRHSELISAELPQATLHRLPGEGHFSLPMLHMDRILDDLRRRIDLLSYS
jgi:pimeloyl-ACP methyl ester carboxylesterase